MFCKEFPLINCSIDKCHRFANVRVWVYWDDVGDMPQTSHGWVMGFQSHANILLVTRFSDKSFLHPYLTTLCVLVLESFSLKFSVY